ncbi:MAG: DUF1553 domain-containing protein [Bacteroidetes bacterium]|nr:DUF1553 domain-containing protein [Bacteroidota bacterium]
MWSKIFLLNVVLIVGCIGCGPTSDFEGTQLPEIVDYNYHIRPILSDRCYVCHGPDGNARQAGLRLDEQQGAKHTPLSSGGYAVVSGSIRKSHLYERITSSDPDHQMPPPESNLTISDHEIALIGRWIDQGAEWKPHWSFIPPTDLPVPSVQLDDWPSNQIDYFVLSRLEQEGLIPSAEANRGTLLRRVTFDITGLPPTIEELDEFLSDTSADAYEKVVDRLLASPAYGEHMASMWLDIARYADTHGYQNDPNRYVWPWRDWVISAYNQNLPFNQFGTWQIAGDQLTNPTVEQRLATAFNRHHRQTNEGGSIEEEFRTEYVADRVNTVGAAFMGLTLECARCHDHKYDPITQRNYFGLFSFFNNIDEIGQTSHFTQAVPVPAMDLPVDGQQKELDRLINAITAAERALVDLTEAAQSDFESWDPSNVSNSFLDPILSCSFEQMRHQQLSCDRGINGTAVFTPISVSGHIGNAMAFDGESGFTFEDIGNFRRTEPFAVSLWVKPNEDTGIIIHRTHAALDAGSRGWELALSDGYLVGQLAHMWPENAVRIQSKAPIMMDEWTHIAMSYDGSSRASGLHLYINGFEAEMQVIRDGLSRHIGYQDMEVPLQLAYRFRDSGLRGGAMDELRVFDRKLYGFEVARLAGQFKMPLDQEDLFEWYLANHVPSWKNAHLILKTLLIQKDDLLKEIPEIMVMEEMANPRQAFILDRGMYDAKGAPVEPHTPEAILPFSEDFPQNRLGLAKWLFSPDHPLTARVAVNRYWQNYFGTGIVSTPEDFGFQGALPIHPELLDHLAARFIASNWDIKAMQRYIVTSSTYRQSSEPTLELISRDPDNDLLARGPRLRLGAEMIRDQALAVSGLLDQSFGGPPVKPYQPAGLWKQKSGIVYDQGSGRDLYRRTLYTFFKRTSPPPSLTTFDMPTRDHCVLRRQRTATPMQALVLLNDPQYVEAARHLASRMLGKSALEHQIRIGFRALTGRAPSTSETITLSRLYAEQYELYSMNPQEAMKLLSVGESDLDKSHDPVQWASLTMVANALFSFDESIQKY